jgi:hypothetical protein
MMKSYTENSYEKREHTLNDTFEQFQRIKPFV